MDYTSEFRFGEKTRNISPTTPTTTATTSNVNPFLPQNIRNKVNYFLLIS